VKNLLRRVDRLEQYLGSGAGFGCGRRGFRGKRFHPPLRVRFGKVRRLPEDYRGERHIVVAKQLPERNGQEWVEFEEVPGPKPMTPPPDLRVPQYLNVMFVTARGGAEEDEA